MVVNCDGNKKYIFNPFIDTLLHVNHAIKKLPVIVLHDKYRIVSVGTALFNDHVNTHSGKYRFRPPVYAEDQFHVVPQYLRLDNIFTVPTTSKLAVGFVWFIHTYPDAFIVILPLDPLVLNCNHEDDSIIQYGLFEYNFKLSPNLDFPSCATSNSSDGFDIPIPTLFVLPHHIYPQFTVIP